MTLAINDIERRILISAIKGRLSTMRSVYSNGRAGKIGQRAADGIVASVKLLLKLESYKP